MGTLRDLIWAVVGYIIKVEVVVLSWFGLECECCVEMVILNDKFTCRLATSVAQAGTPAPLFSTSCRPHLSIAHVYQWLTER